MDPLKYEFFKFDVKITESRFGFTARWDNYKHPDNPHFQQQVHWIAYENSDKTSVIIRFSLDLQMNHIYDFETIPYNGNFEQTIFDYWSK